MNKRQLLSFTRRACADFNMISEGDKIAVGISGGKDSLSLLIALAELRRFYPQRFELMAITVSLGFDYGTENVFAPVQTLCDSLNVEYRIVETDIGQIIFDERKEKNPCSLCSKMRKGALHDEAKRLGCNKVAYGHSKDDTIETFFMALLYEGRIHTFMPVTYLDKTDLHTIRPLIYVPEKDIISFVKNNGITIVKSCCPADGYTKRQEIKEFVRRQNNDFDNFNEKVFGAILRSSLRGWDCDK